MCTLQSVKTDDVIAAEVTCENAGDCKRSEAVHNLKFTYEKIDCWLPISSTHFSRGGQAFLFSVAGNAIGLMGGQVKVSGKVEGNIPYVLALENAEKQTLFLEYQSQEEGSFVPSMVDL